MKTKFDAIEICVDVWFSQWRAGRELIEPVFGELVVLCQALVSTGELMFACWDQCQVVTPWVRAWWLLEAWLARASSMV